MNKITTNLLATIARLRDPLCGCPWDLAQTHLSLLPYLMEESYELKEALTQIAAKEDEEIPQEMIQQVKNELGDILLQVLLHAQLASEKKWFHFLDICEHLNEKMIYRHPHVFASDKKLTKQEVEQQWLELKQKESHGTAPGLPGKHKKTPRIPTKVAINEPLRAAHKIGELAAKHQFDWDNPAQVLLKVEEEFLEMKAAIESKNKDHLQEELGDLLFSLIQYARHENLEAHEALHTSNTKFLKRFQQMEALCEEKGLVWEQLSLNEKETLWKEVKRHETTKKLG